MLQYSFIRSLEGFSRWNEHVQTVMAICSVAVDESWSILFCVYLYTHTCVVLYSLHRFQMNI